MGVWMLVWCEQVREGWYKVGVIIVFDGVSESFDLWGGFEYFEVVVQLLYQ